MTDNGRLGRRGATEAKPTKGDHDDELRQLTHRTSSGSFATFTAIRRAFIALLSSHSEGFQLLSMLLIASLVRAIRCETAQSPAATVRS
jgi:hypothetical protein